MTINARVITDDQVEDAVRATLKLWIPSRLSEIEDQLSLSVGYYQRPVAYAVRTDFDKFPEEMLPAVIVVSLGVGDNPAKTGRGVYRAKWNIGVVCVAASLDQEDSRRAAYRIGAAARASLIHRQSLDGALSATVRGVDWVGVANSELPSDGERTIWAQRQVFSVEVDNVVTLNAGPVGPDGRPPVDTGGDPIEDPPPGGEWPVITDRSKIRTVFTHATIPGGNP